MCQNMGRMTEQSVQNGERETWYVNGITDELKSLRNGRRIGDKSRTKVMQQLVYFIFRLRRLFFFV